MILMMTQTTLTGNKLSGGNYVNNVVLFKIIYINNLLIFVRVEKMCGYVPYRRSSNFQIDFPGVEKENLFKKSYKRD